MVTGTLAHILCAAIVPSSCMFVQCRMQWHKQGDYLCVKINRWATKSKKVCYQQTMLPIVVTESVLLLKNLTYSFEIFRMRQSLIPVDTIEMKGMVCMYAYQLRLFIVRGICCFLLSVQTVQHECSIRVFTSSYQLHCQNFL